jgi:hypothetical protein
MITLNPEYVVDKHQKRKAVLVTTGEWKQDVSELEWANCGMSNTIPHGGLLQ